MMPFIATCVDAIGTVFWDRPNALLYFSGFSQTRQNWQIFARWLALALVIVLEIDLVLALEIEHYHITASVSHLTPLPATTSVSHLTCPLPLHHCITASVSHLTCIDDNISQSFDLPNATTSVYYLLSPH